MRFEELLERWETGRLSHGEAAAALGVSERTFRRWRGRYGEEGAAGLVDRRIGKPSPRRAPEDELQRMLRLYHEHYAGFVIRHFHDVLCRRHGYQLGYTTTRLWLQKSGAVAAAAKRGAHRRKRPRRPMVGMMLHQDASTHAWLVGQPPLDLVITLDDATSALYSAVLVEQEGTASSLLGLAEVIGRHGLFIELYTDRGSHYFHTPAAGGKVSKTQLTQVGRALKQLGIGHIAAYSPQARGRCERAFRTLQDRLPKELRLAGITTVAAANRYLRETWLSEHNARFAVTPEESASAFITVPPELWRDVLCVQEERQVGNDNCVRWRGRVLQIPPSPLRPHFVRATVRLHEYPDGAVAIFNGPHRLATFPAPAEPSAQNLAA
ncbi:MAG: ISNCY family transposase [Geminicoccaceae bacterium]